MDIETMIEISERGRNLYMLNDENLIELIKSENELQNYLSDSVDVIDEAIARQSVKSEEVQEAIEWIENERESILHYASLHALPSGQLKAEKSYRIAIAALQAYQPWIPVSNVKPEKSGRYIAYVPEHWTDEGHKEGKVIIAYFRELNYEGRRRAWDDGAYSISGEVTHYLPLPEPPKENE